MPYMGCPSFLATTSATSATPGPNEYFSDINQLAHAILVGSVELKGMKVSLSCRGKSYGQVHGIKPNLMCLCLCCLSSASSSCKEPDLLDIFGATFSCKFASHIFNDASFIPALEKVFGQDVSVGPPLLCKEQVT